jgi:hypothetical protein
MNTLKKKAKMLDKSCQQKGTRKRRKMKFITLSLSLTALGSFLIACTPNQKYKSKRENMPATEYMAPDKPLINPNDDPFAIQ